MKRRYAALLLCAAASTPLSAQVVVCHVAFAGSTRSFVIPPQEQTAPVEPQLYGALLQWGASNHLSTDPEAGITVRAWSVHGGQLSLLHQAQYWPGTGPTGPHGFTGLQVVREPQLGSELAYWCERRTP